MHNEINNLTQQLNQDKQINAVWGSKKLYKKQWQTEDDELWQKEWQRKRNHHIYSIGSKDETFGNYLCQLQTLTKLRLTLPKALGKHLSLEVNFNYPKRRIYQYLMFVIANKKALTYRIIEKEKGWYVQIAFSLPCIAEHQSNGTLGIDINYNLIATCLVKPDGNEESFKNFKFDLRNKSKHQIKQILCDAAQEVVDQAYANNKNIILEKIDLSKCKAKLKSKRTNEKLSLIAYAKLIQFIKYKALKQHVLVIEVNPAYTSVIGKNKYRKKLGIGVHSAASYCIGVPCELASLLQSGERRKHHWSQWASIDKKLKKVPLKEKDTNIFTDLAEILCANDV